LLLQGFWLFSGNLARSKVRIILGKDEIADGGDTEYDRPYLGHGRPAERNHDKGSGKFRDRRADIAHAEKAQRRPLFLLRIPFGDIGNAYGKAAAGKAQSKRRNEHQQIGVGIGQQECRCRRCQHGERKHQSPAILIGPYAEEQPGERPGQNGRSHEQAKLGIVEAQFGLDFDADYRKYRPDCKTDRKGKCAQAERTVLVSNAWHLNGRHGMAPIECSRVAIG